MTCSVTSRLFDERERSLPSEASESSVRSSSVEGTRRTSVAERLPTHRSVLTSDWRT
jgi:hypothetical protein